MRTLWGSSSVLGDWGQCLLREYMALGWGVGWWGGWVCQVGTPPRGGVSKEEYDQWIVC